MSLFTFIFQPILDRIDQLESNTMSVLTDLTARVAEVQTVNASAIALLQGLKQKLDDAIMILALAVEPRRSRA